MLRLHPSQKSVPCPRIISGFSTTASKHASKSHGKRAPKAAKEFEAKVLAEGKRLIEINGILRRTVRGKYASVEAKVPVVELDHIGKAGLQYLKAISDVRYPTEWFPHTRALQRTIHLHIGPTNSGKTYQALKRLEEAETGLYAGPLRLLAHEVFTRLNAKGKPCNLTTGDDRRVVGVDVPMTSCTVEMVPLGVRYDVAVIDEIQMIGSSERGWAWTRALMGLQAKELHLCGEKRSESLIRQLAALMGDKLEVHHHERLSPLEPMKQSLRGRLKDLEKGDALIVFSRDGILAMKDSIEKRTGKRCAVVYGSLPPEIRAEQARLFNDPDNDYDIVVASDAIGMGLNLSIKRVVFFNAWKWAFGLKKPLPISEIKQIAGRAGRYRTAHQAMQKDVAGSRLPATTMGLVTTLEDADFPLVEHALATEPKPIISAGLFPPVSIVQRFAATFPPETPFSHVLVHLDDQCRLDARFHMCLEEEQLQTAQLIDEVKNLTVEERLTFCVAPTRLRADWMQSAVLELARCVGENKSGDLLDIPNLPLGILEKKHKRRRIGLPGLENLHLILVLYLWLSYRFPSVFTTRALAVHVKEVVEQRIDQMLVDDSLMNSSSRHSKRFPQLERSGKTPSLPADEGGLTRYVIGGKKRLTPTMPGQKVAFKGFLPVYQLESKSQGLPTAVN
ncbi:MAG: RNA helicase [Peltula sp. TS41687]|nr:MAG: RNA helicase [Peltula sp. TS41687]